jgi:recombination protein RecA
MAKKLNPLLSKVIEKLHKDFSKDSLITVGLSKENVEVVPSGIFSIDLAIGIGGWPRGRIIEIYGPESSGKTSIAMSGLKAYQVWQDQLPSSHPHKDRMALVVDVEHSLVGSFFKSMGIDMQRVLYAKADSVEEAFQSMLDLTKTEQIGYTFLDSIDALQNERMLQRDIGEADMGGISKDTSRFFREYSKVCENTDTIAIFLNQLRHNPGKMFGN